MNFLGSDVTLNLQNVHHMPMSSGLTSFFRLYELCGEQVGKVLFSCDGYMATLK
jgi:hypothetical protein